MKLLNKILLPFICATLISPSVMAKDPSKPLDKIEAVVNQEVILSSDITRMQKDIISRYAKKGQTLPSDGDLQKQILDKLITDRLQLQIADRIGMRINDAQLDQTLQQIAKDEGLTLAQLKQQVQARGDSYAAYVDMIRDELTINEIRQMQVRRRINISDQEVEQMVDRLNEQGEKTTKFNFAHIMLKIGKDAPADKQQAMSDQADELAVKIKQGENVQTLAVEFSQGPKSLEGGNWGWRTLDEIPSLFAKVFDDQKTKKGDLIGPFRTDMGFHLIKILDKKGTENIMTVEVKARHILIKSNIILSDEKAKQLLVNFREEILAGTKTFAELAEANSQDPGSAVKGGDLGWADPSMYVPEFRDLSLSMPIGEISAPFRTMHGWHILQVMEKRESDTTEDATKQKAYGMLFKQRFPGEVYSWMNEIRQEAYIKINNPDYVMDEK
ncbi:peptidylprolyl isomerase SurA [Psychromonas sp. Urea-02u-13]|uniref:peptidylprolyl isomerase SurA n=1 Tax=Psychromonas sp. Urea-02u-13 TaxID=2058326 RepID=UPI000C31EE2D|nr:peptidylprolyl isomerase SurA [Psychromonas sp. Urea-02u-13]PKG38253.1 peptidylprolyl isomerase SurA [Psychromonas sp. Urea-02u-13]